MLLRGSVRLHFWKYEEVDFHRLLEENVRYGFWRHGGRGGGWNWFFLAFLWQEITKRSISARYIGYSCARAFNKSLLNDIVRSRVCVDVYGNLLNFQFYWLRSFSRCTLTEERKIACSLRSYIQFYSETTISKTAQWCSMDFYGTRISCLPKSEVDNF